MVRRKSTTTAKREILVEEGLLGIKTKKYKSPYAAEESLQLPKDSIKRRASGGISRSQAHHTKQKLSSVQEKVLLKWIKKLIVSGYSPGHRLLKEIAEELRSKRTYDLDDASLDTLEPLPQLPLGKDWAPRFILRHPHLTVAIGRRIDSLPEEDESGTAKYP